MQKLSHKKEIKKWMRTIILAIIMFAMCYPLLHTFVQSVFMRNADMIETTKSHFSLNQYEILLLKEPKYLMLFWNTIKMSVFILIGQVVVSILGGYAFSKFNFKGRDLLFFLYIILMILPVQVTLVPQYLMIHHLRLDDSIWAVILPAMFHPFGVFLLAQFMRGIPKTLLEVSTLEGANKIQVLFELIIPLSKGGITALIILNLIDSWNMMEQPLIFLKNATNYPLSLFLAWVRPMDSEGVIYAASIIFLLPILFLFLYTKDELIEGISYSCIKG